MGMLLVCVLLCSCGKSLEEAYPGFFPQAEYLTVIPGLEQNMIPQGLTSVCKGKYLLISAYSEEKEASCLYLVEAGTNGPMIKSVKLLNEKGEAFTGHVGGLASDEEYIFISGSKRIYVILLDEFMKLEAEDEVRLEHEIKTAFGTSFLNYSDGYLWSGFFYEPKDYKTDDFFHKTTTDGEEYGSWASAYSAEKVKAASEQAMKTGSSELIPDLAFSIRDKIQGITVSDGRIVLSESYGRRNDSHLFVYDIPKLADCERQYEGNSIPLYILDSRYLIEEYTLPPMAEGITEIYGRVCILFESGASKYKNGFIFFRAKNPTDGVWIFTP